jgi:arylformamidase
MPLTSDYMMHTPAGVEDVQLRIQTLKDYDVPGGDGQIVRGITMRLHHGTHVDAPEHYVKNGASVSDLPLDIFYGPAVIARLTSQVRGTGITVEDLRKALPASYRPGDRLIIRTDWNQRYGESRYLEDSPYLTCEAIDWCVAEGFQLVGFDFAHVKDDPRAPLRFYATRRFCESGVVPMGYVTNLHLVAHDRVLLAAFPLAVIGVEASPVRAVVLDGAI